MKATILFLIGCSLGVSPDSSFFADKTDPELAGMNPALLARSPARMTEFVDVGKKVGLVTLVARHGHVVGLDAVSYQDLEHKTPMKVDTICRIMSVTNPVTCAGVMILVDEGRLSLLYPVEKFVPEFKRLKANPGACTATLRSAVSRKLAFIAPIPVWSI